MASGALRGVDGTEGGRDSVGEGGNGTGRHSVGKR